MNQQQALHNEALCDHLIAQGKWPDWVVTTAFYSALHFAQHTIFPYEDDSGKTYSSFHEYCAPEAPGHSREKHKLMKILIQEKVNCIAGDYARLLEVSWNARYHGYKSPGIAQVQARKLLERIKGNCI